MEDFIDSFLESNPTLSREEQDEYRRVQRQADAYTPEELHKLFQVGRGKGREGLALQRSSRRPFLVGGLFSGYPTGQMCDEERLWKSSNT